MMKSLSQTNSWHWLMMSMVASLAVGAYLAHSMWSTVSKENNPKIEAMRTHGEALVLLDEADALMIEKQVADIEKRVVAYDSAVRNQTGNPIPEGEQSVLSLSNEINSTLQKNNLRIVEREQVAERPIAATANASAPSPEARRAAAAQAAATLEAEQKKNQLPYTTREIHYVLEGEYKDMFMFLVKQSHLKPPYHFKNIRITPAPDREGMRMAFTVEIHFI